MKMMMEVTTRQLICREIRASTLSKMEQSTVASGLVDIDTDMESKHGLTELGMKENGSTIKLTEGVFSIMLMVTSLMESGETIKQMAMEHITM